MIEVGDTLAGKYRVLAELGAGGMGRVFRAENTLTGKQVALKCLHAHLTAGADASERLLREARAVSSLTHSNVVDVYDVVRDGDTLFLVMELLKGETLRAYLLRNPHPKISEFIALILPAMSGVEAAHQSGVIHRDLKPENIFLAQVGGMRQAVIKVLDFGIAKLAVARGATLTRTGAALGTPLYMSLEQLRGDKDVDQRADVYAFGVMLYEAVTGLMPYEAETLPELAIKVATTDAPPVKSLRPDVPTALARIIDWAVARDRKQRLPDLQTLQQELELFAHDRSFREQMTKRDEPLPRLAAEPDGTAATSPAPRVPPRAAAAPAAAMLRPEADTLRAKEVARSRSTAKASLLRSRWVLGGAAVASVLVVGSLWFQGQGAPGSAASSTPTTTETNAAVAAPTPNVAAPVPHAQPAALPKPLSAPGASDTAVEAAPEASAKNAEQMPAASKVNERSPMDSPLPSEKAPTKPAPAPVHDNRPKARSPAPAPVAAPVLVKPQPVLIQAEKTPPATPAAPAKKTPRDLVGF